MEKFLSSLALAAGLTRGLVYGCLLVPRGLGPHRRRRRWRWRLKLRLRLRRRLNRLRLRCLRLRRLDPACLTALVLAAAPAAPMSLRRPLPVSRNWPQFNLGLCQFCRHACASCCRAGCCLASSGSDFFFKILSSRCTLPRGPRPGTRQWLTKTSAGNHANFPEA